MPYSQKHLYKINAIKGDIMGLGFGINTEPCGCRWDGNSGKIETACTKHKGINNIVEMQQPLVRIIKAIKKTRAKYLKRGFKLLKVDDDMQIYIVAHQSPHDRIIGMYVFKENAQMCFDKIPNKNNPIMYPCRIRNIIGQSGYRSDLILKE